MGPLNIGLAATPDGTVASATGISSLPRTLRINAGRTVRVPITLRSAPSLGVGTYELISEVTQSNGTITTTDPAIAPVFTVATPTVATGFTDTIVTATEKYTYDQFAGFAQHITQLDLTMSIKNAGATSTGADQFTLFASANPTFDSSAVEENSLPLTLTVIKGGIRTFYINFNMPDNGPDDGTVIDRYIFVQVTDPFGAITMASYPTPISFAGPIVP